VLFLVLFSGTAALADRLRKKISVPPECLDVFNVISRKNTNLSEKVLHQTEINSNCFSKLKINNGRFFFAAFLFPRQNIHEFSVFRSKGIRRVFSAFKIKNKLHFLILAVDEIKIEFAEFRSTLSLENTHEHHEKLEVLVLEFNHFADRIEQRQSEAPPSSLLDLGK
jgi:hypothetical protein